METKKIKLHKLQGIEGTLQAMLENDKIIIDSLLKTIKSLDEEITYDELFKLCLCNVMKDGKGHFNPAYVNEMIKIQLDYIK